MARKKPRTSTVRAPGGQAVPVIVGASKLQVLVGELHDFKSVAPEEHDGEKVSFRGQRDVLRCMEEIRQQEGSPHKTQSDQMRDAAAAWVTAWHELNGRRDPKITAWLHHHRIQSEAAWLERHYGEVETAVHRLSDHLMGALGKGRFAQAHAAVLRHWGEIRQIQDGDWRQDYIDASKAEGGLVIVVGVLAKLGYKIPPDLKGALV